MAIIPLAEPYVMSDATLTIVADDYTAAVTEVRFEPSVQASSVRTIDGKVRRGQSKAEWAVTVGHLQDLAPAGLSRYLVDHDGELQAVVFTPKSGGPSIEVDVYLAPGQLGGPASESGLTSASSTWAVDGAPVFVDLP